MDKYEYRIRAEEINELIEKKEYVEAVKIADTIDWRRVRSVVMLCKVSELYKINRRYEDSKEVLLLAYELQNKSRKIIYSLCELSIKLEETVQAVEYYKEFIKVAPKDTGRFILQYRLYEAQDVSLEERIAVLEEYKKRDYREKWAYELAYLYHRIGLATRCIEECDELILWFGEGKYVIKALELKMLHAPLTPEQQEKYNARFMVPVPEVVEEPVAEEVAQEVEPSLSIEIKSVEATKAKTAEIPTKRLRDEIEELPQEETSEDLQEVETEEEVAEETGEEPEVAAQEEVVDTSEEMDIQVKMIDVGDEYNTINLQEVLARNLAEMLAQEDMEAADATRALPVASIFEATSQNFVEKQEEDAEEPKNNDIEEIKEIKVPIEEIEDLENAETLDEVVEPMEEEKESEQPKVVEESVAPIVEEKEPEQLRAVEESVAPIVEEKEPEQPKIVEESTAPIVEEKELKHPEEAEESEKSETKEESKQPEEKAEELKEVEEIEEIEETQEEVEVLVAPIKEEQEPEQPKAVEESTAPVIEEQEPEQPKEEESTAPIVEEQELKHPEVEEESEKSEIEEESKQPEEKAEELKEVEEIEEIEETQETQEEVEVLVAPVKEEQKPEQPKAVEESTAPIVEEKEPEQPKIEEESTAPMEEEKELEHPEEAEESEKSETEEKSEQPEEKAEELKEVEEIEEIEETQETQKEVEVLVAPVKEEQEPEQPKALEESTAPVKEVKEVQPIVFGQNQPLPEEFILAVQNAAMEAAKEAAKQAAKEAAKQAAAEVAQVTAEVMKEIKPGNSVVEEPEKIEEKAEEPTEVAIEETQIKEPEENQQVEKQITGQLSFSDIMAEWEETKKANEEKHLQEMKQRVMEQTGPLFSDFDSLARTNMQSDLNMLSPMIDVFSDTDDLATEVETALKEEEKPAVEENLFVEEEPVKQEESFVAEEPAKQEEFFVAEEPAKQEESFVAEEPVKQEESFTVAEVTMKTEPVEETPGTLEKSVIESASFIDIQEKPIVSSDSVVENVEIEDRPSSFNTEEINGLEEKLMGALGSQHYETEKIQASVLENEMSAPSKPVEIGPRGLTKEEKDLFGAIAPNREIQENIANVLDRMSFIPNKENVIVIGEKATGVDDIVKNLVLYLSKANRGFSGKTKTYSCEEFTGKDIFSIVNELANGVLIIENAGNMSADLCNKLFKAEQEMNHGGILYILVDTKAGIEKLSKTYARIYDYFNLCIEIAALDNDRLVKFGKEYAHELEYSIDDMGVLALYNRIEEKQTSEHAVTVDEVKKMIHQAIENSEKKNFSHFMDVIFAKRYDKEDMIVLREKDFINE